jgi:hypothetical protein
MVPDGREGASPWMALVLKQSSDCLDRAQVWVVDASDVWMVEQHPLPRLRELRLELFLLVLELFLLVLELLLGLFLLVLELRPADEEVQNADDKAKHARDQGNPDRSHHSRIMALEWLAAHQSGKTRAFRRRGPFSTPRNPTN